MEFLSSLFGNVTPAMYGEAILVTVKITLFSTFLSYILGIPLGVLLYGTSRDSIFPNTAVNSIVGTIVNIIRSIPFIILLIFLIHGYVCNIYVVANSNFSLQCRIPLN